jgi:hypothetical protein
VKLLPVGQAGRLDQFAGSGGFARPAMPLSRKCGMTWKFLIATSSDEQHGYKGDAGRAEERNPNWAFRAK